MPNYLNFHFCNDEFLPLFCLKPYYLYNQFNLPKSTKACLDSMGQHPDCSISFRYDAEKRIRATFFIFEEANEELDVKAICTVFHGDRGEYHCYFFEVYMDGGIGCIEVASNKGNLRLPRFLNAGTDVDGWFDKICFMYGKSAYDTVTMYFYREADACFRLLDMNLEDLPSRSIPLLGGAPDVSRKTVQGTEFVFYRSRKVNDYLAARVGPDGEPADVLLGDSEILSGSVHPQT